uniref:Uncharacterized protein n=1 Tax=Setaria italica TaxID=4555 RepID=K4ANK0_SETIT
MPATAAIVLVQIPSKDAFGATLCFLICLYVNFTCSRPNSCVANWATVAM